MLALATALRSNFDGNALAIELAATRAPPLSVAVLRQRPGERLLVLHSRGATRPDAQRAMLRRIGQF